MAGLAWCKEHNAVNYRDSASKVMIELLGSYTESTASQAKDDACKCILTSLADPKSFLLDHLLTLKPVKSLEGEKIYEVSLDNYFTNRMYI